MQELWTDIPIEKRQRFETIVDFAFLDSDVTRGAKLLADFSKLLSENELEFFEFYIKLKQQEGVSANEYNFNKG